MTNTHLLKERRKFPRHITLLNYQIEGLISDQNDLVVNLSQGGGKIYINKPLKTGEHKKIQFCLPGISYTATSMVKIAWQRKIGLDSPAKYEAGVKFLDISPVKLNTLLERKQLIFSNHFQFKVLLKTFAAAACIVSALAQSASSQTVAPGSILSILLEGLNDRISWVASQNPTDEASFSWEQSPRQHPIGFKFNQSLVSVDDLESAPEPITMASLVLLGATFLIPCRHLE
ncbi:MULTISPECIES: PilZ domain-containing protein [Moorena]|uniref:PilZ domain protein n=1 Tax=Moorena producens 3L TaxID=489825 RepID=F4XLA2_9CYAN|nr:MULTISPECIES: PilZ domain-containing protein [Moorena]NEQ16637.1 PilZ domain-containing protein [Moorena sp. SIO3E2]EGJ34626.1 PilZ domain protein [Moorena producens 3L]NEP30440.1 PilZ domain-containing protein [Moorena sp. SIO3B2]NEP65330.1 PilZ domain-containing protein [Moorena sp. SIO3A5]NEQ11139.1 PilZ domain-containing protein [Moorena sp. SIO4E2]